MRYNNTIFKKGKVLIGVNLCGGLFNFPDMPIDEYMAQLKKKVRDIAEARATFLLAWLFVPLTAKPDDTPAFRRNLTIVKPGNGVWTHTLNDAFFKKILLPFHEMCREYDLIPVYGLTGYTRSNKLYPPSASLKSGTLYSKSGAEFFKKVLKKICTVLPDKNFIIEPTNEPHTLQVRDREKAVRVNYEVVKFHAEIVDYGTRVLGLKEWNFQMNFEEGFSRTTGERAKCYPMAFGSRHFRGAIDILRDSYEFVNDEKNHRKMKRTDVIFCGHAIGQLADIIGNHSSMKKNQAYSGLFVMPDKKYRRLFSNVAVSNDGFKIYGDRLHGDRLKKNVYEVGKYAKKHNTDRAVIWYVHLAPYILKGGNKAVHLHTIDLSMIDVNETVRPAAEACINLYGISR